MTAEINEDNCVLNPEQLDIVEEMTKYWESLGPGVIWTKIKKLNDMAKELHDRKITVKAIIQMYELGKQAEEKQE